MQLYCVVETGQCPVYLKTPQTEIFAYRCKDVAPLHLYGRAAGGTFIGQCLYKIQYTLRQFE